MRHQIIGASLQQSFSLALAGAIVGRLGGGKSPVGLDQVLFSCGPLVNEGSALCVQRASDVNEFD